MRAEGEVTITLDRLKGLSDGIFSIVLTLLVLNLSLGNATARNDAEVWAVLRPLAPKLIGYIISFLVIGVFWLLHVGTLNTLRSLNRRTAWANLVFFLPITLLPFTTDLQTRFRTPLAWSVYAASVAGAALGLLLVWRSARSGGHLSTDDEASVVPLRATVLAGVFLLSIAVAYSAPGWERYAPFLVPLAYRLMGRWHRAPVHTG